VLKRAIYSKKHAFSLIEMAIVLAISGLMVGFVLQSNQTAGPANISECVTASTIKEGHRLEG
jgi:prepilin-type N-terminal cleavage/methylation domain-containing protein